jgi:homocysteine S-methyltransferase
MEVLRDAGADMFLIETIPSYREAVVCADLAEEIGLDYWISFSCMSGTKINEGDPVRNCVRDLARRDLSREDTADHGSVYSQISSGPRKFPHLKMIGVNCTDPKFIVSLIEEIKAGLEEAGSDLPIAVYPNSGEKYDPMTKTWTKAGEGLAFGAYALEYMKAGASAVGGCCTTVASHIRQVWKARENFLESQQPY